MPLLEVRGLSRYFGGLAAVKGLDLDVHEGEILSIIGPNGAGKTTIFNLITGYMQPHAGTIRFKGESIGGLKPHQISQRGIGRTFQIVRPFPRMTVMDNVLVAAFSKLDHGRARQEAWEVLRFTNLYDRKDQPASGLTLAGKRRLEIARALATKPDLILLDEVFAGLNPKEVEETIDLIIQMRKKGISAMAGVEHVMKVVMAISDRIVVLHHGEKIAEGSPREVAKDRAVVSAYLGEEYA